jgi:hypothetical protein
MPSRLTKRCLKVIAVLFTSLVAPLTVHLAESDLKAEGVPAASAAGLTQTACYAEPSPERGLARRASSALVVGRDTASVARRGHRR